MSTALVTGGAGFIGSHLVDALLARGVCVRVLDNLDPLAHPDGPPAHLDPEAELVVGDLRDRAAVDRALAGVEVVFHLGGVVGNGDSMIRTRRAVDANCVGTATLMEAVVARRETVRRVVVASSVVVYGEGAYRCPEHGATIAPPRSLGRLRRRLWEPACPRCGREMRPMAAREGQALAPTSVYAVTKRDQEELVLTLGRAYGVEAVALRYHNVYGPRQALGNPYTGVAAIFAARALAGRPALVFEDGRQLRDLVHVSDAVRATIAAMNAPGAEGRALNIASGVRMSVGELACRVSGALGGPEPRVTGEFRAGDVRHWFADPALARRAMGFQAVRRLDDELPAFAEWVSRQTVGERSEPALAELRARGLVG